MSGKSFIMLGIVSLIFFLFLEPVFAADSVHAKKINHISGIGFYFSSHLDKLVTYEYCYQQVDEDTTVCFCACFPVEEVCRIIWKDVPGGYPSTVGADAGCVWDDDLWYQVHGPNATWPPDIFSPYWLIVAHEYCLTQGCGTI